MQANPFAHRAPLLPTVLPRPLTRTLPLAALSALALALTLTSLPALAVGRLADITVIDRNTGATLPVYSHRGEYWVAGTPGARYAVAVQSRYGQRLLAVPAVDGINVLSGQTAAWNQTGYVFSSFSQYQITGWRKSNAEVAAFEFSSLGDSYAGLTGRPANVGVIGVALFKEKQAPAPVYDPEISRNDSAWPSARSKSAGRPLAEPAPAADSTAPTPAPAPASPIANRPTDRAPRNTNQSANESASESARSGNAASGDASGHDSARRSAPQATAKLGTAHGQRESSVVSSTAFERQQPQPDEVVRIRYDSRANLVALGVIRVPPVNPSGPTPNAFPDSATAYVPDPPLRRY